jgi:hypothetical protein
MGGLMDHFVLVVNYFLANQPNAMTQTRLSFTTLAECNAALETVTVQLRRGRSLEPGALTLSKCTTGHEVEGTPEDYQEVPKD